VWFSCFGVFADNVCFGVLCVLGGFSRFGVFLVVSVFWRHFVDFAGFRGILDFVI